jgi:hypothetical protein
MSTKIANNGSIVLVFESNGKVVPSMPSLMPLKDVTRSLVEDTVADIEGDFDPVNTPKEVTREMIAHALYVYDRDNVESIVITRAGKNILSKVTHHGFPKNYTVPDCVDYITASITKKRHSVPASRGGSVLKGGSARGGSALRGGSVIDSSMSIPLTNGEFTTINILDRDLKKSLRQAASHDEKIALLTETIRIMAMDKGEGAQDAPRRTKQRTPSIPEETPQPPRSNTGINHEAMTR